MLSRWRMRGRGSCGAQRAGIGILLGGSKAWPARGVSRWLAALRREAVVKVIAKATEKSSWSLKWGEGLGAADIANKSIKSTKTGVDSQSAQRREGKIRVRGICGVCGSVAASDCG